MRKTATGASIPRLWCRRTIDPDKIPASGKDGRLTKEDVLAFVNDGGSAAETPAPQAVSTHPVEVSAALETPRAPGEREERVRMTRLRQSIAKHLKDAQNTAAMLTTFNEVDMGAVMDRSAQGI